MEMRNRTLTKMVSLPVLAVSGFVAATVFAGVGVAVGTTTSTSTSTSTTTTSTTTSTTTTTTTTTTTPKGEEGCTPGFWKNHFEGSSPLLGDVFTGLPSSYQSMTLEQALWLGGGGLNALLRHAAAALLNSMSGDVDYAYSTSEVIAMTNAAIASGSYEATKNLFDAANNGGADGFCD